MQVRCHHCSYTWNYKGNRTVTNCPRCKYKVFLTQQTLNNNFETDITQGLQNLTVHLKTDEDRVRLVPWGDVHIGAPKGQCLWAKARAELGYVLLRKNTYLIGMGDYMDCAQKMPWRRGPNIFQSSLQPMEQYQLLLEALKPLAKVGKILGLHSGNHERWIMEDTGIQIIKLLCDSLNVPFLGEGCKTTVYVNKQKYLVYGRHGSSGARYRHTKLAALINQTKDVMADLYLMGHVHQIAAMKGGKYVGPKITKTYYVLTGHFLNWKGSYAQAFGFDISPAGCVQIKLFADRHDIHVSI